MMECLHCTFVNPPNTKVCEVCSKTLHLYVSNEPRHNGHGVQCDVCTFINDSGSDSCSMCESEFYEEIADSFINDSSSEADEDQFIDSVEKQELPLELPMEDNNIIQNVQKTCEICYGAFEISFFAMIECTHTFCQECAVGYFTIQITEKTILDCNCPVCDYPNLYTNTDEQNMTFFSLLISSLKPVLDDNILNLFEKKLTERALVSDPNFIWCVRCTSGFINDENTAAAQCPDCRVRFCVKCKKLWEQQHEGISCEKFANWQKDNDPERSKEAIFNYLQKNGIECPKCKFRYDLSRGGCIHFTCTQCKYEFCFGCGQPFLTGTKCTTSSYCKQIGLHSHHFRNCYYYLRDKEIHVLQSLLKANKITFITEKSEGILATELNGKTKEVLNVPTAGTSKSKLDTCPIELQISSGNGVIDSVCNEPSEKGYAGLCRKHYTEYLIMKITKAKLETISILTVNNCHELLRFKGIPFRNQKTTSETDKQYKDICEEMVKMNIGL